MKFDDVMANALIKLLGERDVELTFDNVKVAVENGKVDASSDKMKLGLKKGESIYE